MPGAADHALPIKPVDAFLAGWQAIEQALLRHRGPPFRIVVVGGGAFGAWTALHLREMGHTVTLLDAYGPGNSRATSGDETRQIRCGYGDRELYSQSALRAFTAWRRRQEEFEVDLMVETGRLQLAPEWTASLQATQSTLTKLGVKTERLSSDDIRKRYPQINPEGMGIGAYQARHIVRLAGGELDVTSEPGAGTTFTVRLPAAV